MTESIFHLYIRSKLYPGNTLPGGLAPVDIGGRVTTDESSGPRFSELTHARRGPVNMQRTGSWSLLRGCHIERELPDRERIVAREYEIKRPSIRAHPLTGQACGFARPDVPKVGKVHGSPWTPWLGSVVNADPTLEARVLVGERLTQQVPLQAGVIAYARAAAATRILEDMPAHVDVFRPGWPLLGIESLEEFLSAAVFDTVQRHAGKHHAVRRSVDRKSTRLNS